MKKNLLKADIGLLCSVLQNQSESQDSKAQYKFSQWILKILKKTGHVFTHTYDKYGNLYVTKGKSNLYPCMVAHLDTVHQDKESFVIKRVGQYIMGFDAIFGEQVGCGADDRVGIALSIEMFKLHDNIKLFFPLDEEVGGIGSSKCNISFFDDVAFMIQPDRGYYGQNDYINYTNGISTTSLDFDMEIDDILLKYEFESAKGTFTDIGILLPKMNKPCCAFNLSCYLNAHSDQETVYIPLYMSALNLINDIISRMSYKKWDIEIESFLYSSWQDWGSVFQEDCVYEGMYEDIVNEELAQCPYPECNENNIEEDIDGCLYCKVCQKTLGESYLLNEIRY